MALETWDWDEHWRDREWYDEQFADPAPIDAVSPAVDHALMTSQARTAAAIHILDGIDSPVLPREAITMDGVDWAHVAGDRTMRMLSAGEGWLVMAAHDLDDRGLVTMQVLDEVRRRVDTAGNRRVNEAMRMVGQLVALGDAR